MSDAALLQAALAEARDTRACVVGPGVRRQAGEMFRQQFGNAAAIIVTDPNAFAAAGRDFYDSFRNSGIECSTPIIIDDPKLYAEDAFYQQIVSALSGQPGIPVAVGAGTISDLVKLAAHRLGQPYLCIPTAASMDGYTAFGASITKDGLKQTFDCPAPQAVLADTEVIAAAPSYLNAAGYGDLAAKLTAGADWIAADVLGIEALDPVAWGLVQGHLRDWLGNPDGVATGDHDCIHNLTVGLMMGGFAMQRTKTSRPASGAEHQFSHLWDMQRHTHDGATPWHGFKVAIGTLASTRLYESLFDMQPKHASNWLSREEALAEAEAAFDAPDLKRLAVRDTDAKFAVVERMNERFQLLKTNWPALKRRLAEQLIPENELAAMLAAAGCPTRSEQIGISAERLKTSERLAYFIRRRFTVLDLARLFGAAP